MTREGNGLLGLLGLFTPDIERRKREPKQL